MHSLSILFLLKKLICKRDKQQKSHVSHDCCKTLLTDLRKEGNFITSILHEKFWHSSDIKQGLSCEASFYIMLSYEDSLWQSSFSECNGV